jgi:5-methylthioadenosine/S-adenosylhomocysteine deaminase
MSLAAGLARVTHADDPLSARDVLGLATRDGARALGLGSSTGTLEAGKQADVIVVQASAPHHAPDPSANPYAAIVHASRASDVRLTMVAGRVLYRDGEWTTLDAARAVSDARAEARGVVMRAEPGRAA